MKSSQWYRKQKRRVRKKYTLFLGKYLSPKEAKDAIREIRGYK